jgi:hypothetical protein
LRILVVSPRFAPSNAADSHRIRLLLPHFRDAGVEAEVLAVDARDVGGPVDPWLESRLPSNVPIHRVRAWPLRGWGMGGLAQRALVPLLRRGSSLLAERSFDLVFFSTTEFLLHVLGPVWKSRHGVPFCMDYQDPWVNDYYRQHPDVIPPGGRLKYGLMDRLHRAAERRVAPKAAGFLSVSAAYPRDLDVRYGAQVTSIPRVVLAFPGEPAEFSATNEIAVQEHAVATSSPSRAFTWRYVGRAGADMQPAIRIFLDGWRSACAASASFASSMRLETYGTTYADRAHPAFKASITPLAAEYGLADRVTEHPGRIGYGEMLDMLHGADGLVVFGSDDPSYTASKLYPYLLAGKPLLVICHEESSIVGVIRATGGGQCITFSSSATDTSTTTAASYVAERLAQQPEPLPLNREAFEPYTASAQARTVADWIRTQVLRSGIGA